VPISPDTIRSNSEAAGKLYRMRDLPERLRRFNANSANFAQEVGAIQRELGLVPTGYLDLYTLAAVRSPNLVEPRVKQWYANSSFITPDHVKSADYVAIDEWSLLDGGMDVLNFGSQSGADEVVLAPRVKTWTSVDFTPEVISRLLARSDLGPNIRFECADIRDLPFANGSFDLVLDFSSGDHVQDRREAMHSEIFRVLRPSGRYAIAYANRQFYPDGQRDNFDSFGYECRLTPQELRSEVETSGFKVVEEISLAPRSMLLAQRPHGTIATASGWEQWGTKLLDSGFSERAVKTYGSHLPVLVGCVRLLGARKVCEVGGGFASTLALLDDGLCPSRPTVCTFETDKVYAEAIARKAKRLAVDRWTLICSEEKDFDAKLAASSWDVVLLDAAIADTRIRIFPIALANSEIIILHDAERMASYGELLAAHPPSLLCVPFLDAEPVQPQPAATAVWFVGCKKFTEQAIMDATHFYD